MEALCLALQGLVVPDTCCSRRFLLLGQPCPGTRPRRGLQHCRRYWVVVAGRVLGPISNLLSMRLRMTLLIFKILFGDFSFYLASVCIELGELLRYQVTSRRAAPLPSYRKLVQ